MNGIILCGGNATRMGGVQKALLPLNGRSLIERKIELIRPFVEDIILVTNDLSSFEHLGCSCIPDVEPHVGPLMGIYSGLLRTDTVYNLFTSVDTPFLRHRLIDYLIEHGAQADGFVTTWKGKTEPLTAVYAKSCIPIIRKSLHKYRVVSFYEHADIRYAPESDIRAIDPEGISFFNINTYEDYKRAVEIAGNM
jgi:molybdopterin-guanine dinucleotide biosynthesis protein A